MNFIMECFLHKGVSVLPLLPKAALASHFQYCDSSSKREREHLQDGSAAKNTVS